MVDTPSTNGAGGARRVLRLLPLLALLLAIAAVALLAGGPLGWRAGWWHFGVAFRELMPLAFYCGLAAGVLAIIALVAGRWVAGGRRRLAVGALAFVLGLAVAYVPWHYNNMRGMTPNDITTDLDNPPAYVAVLPLRKADHATNAGDYKPAKAAQQRRAYPDIVPASLPVPPADAFARALKAAEGLGWTIVATDAAAGRREASQRSRWFGFTDDVVIRVTPSEAGSRVDIRSSSRLGTGDFGVNARRVRAFLAALGK